MEAASLVNTGAFIDRPTLNYVPDLNGRAYTEAERSRQSRSCAQGAAARLPLGQFDRGANLDLVQDLLQPVVVRLGPLIGDGAREAGQGIRRAFLRSAFAISALVAAVTVLIATRAG